MNEPSIAAGPLHDIRRNPFGLVYEYAITQNEPGKVNLHPVHYANVYTPAGYDPAGKYPVITVAHPNGGTKEQVARQWPGMRSANRRPDLRGWGSGRQRGTAASQGGYIPAQAGPGGSCRVAAACWGR